MLLFLLFLDPETGPQWLRMLLFLLFLAFVLLSNRSPMAKNVVVLVVLGVRVVIKQVPNR